MENENLIDEENNVFKEFEKISTSNQIFEKTINIDKDFKFISPKIINNLEWKDIYYSNSNNFQNFKYLNQNNLIFKSKKLTKYKIDNFLLFENNNLILNDRSGNIIVFSINENKIISKFNFLKKKIQKN